MSTAYRESEKYVYAMNSIYYSKCPESVAADREHGEKACIRHLEDMANTGWRLVSVTEGGLAWTFFWERLR